MVIECGGDVVEEIGRLVNVDLVLFLENFVLVLINLANFNMDLLVVIILLIDNV